MKRPDHHSRPGWEFLEGKEYDAYKVRELRFKAFRWHGKQCAKCGKRGGKKTDYAVHHRHYRSFGEEKREDVVILCNPCHVDLHARHKRNELTIADAPLVDPDWAEGLK